MTKSGEKNQVSRKLTKKRRGNTACNDLIMVIMTAYICQVLPVPGTMLSVVDALSLYPYCNYMTQTHFIPITT